MTTKARAAAMRNSGSRTRTAFARQMLVRRVHSAHAGTGDKAAPSRPHDQVIANNPPDCV